MKTPAALKTWSDISGNGTTFTKNNGPYQGTIRRVPHVGRWTYSLVREPYMSNTLARGETKTAGEAVKRLTTLMSDAANGNIEGLGILPGVPLVPIAVGIIGYLVGKGSR